jgi:hypothetical protein
MAAARLLVLAVLSSSLLTAAHGETRLAPAPPFPRSASDWIGAPVTWTSLRGQVVLLNVWTFG